MKKRTRDYSMIRRDLLPEKIATPERKIIRSDFIIDQSCFRKSKAERQRLKLAKRGIIVQKKPCRPGKAERLRAAVAKYGSD